MSGDIKAGMQGYGKNLKEISYSGELYHSASLDGLVKLFNSSIDGELSCSTSESKKLFGRECVVVMDVNKEKGLYTPYDADAGKNYGWDEFRLKLNGFNDLRDKIKHVVLSDRLWDVWKNEDWDENEDELELLYELAEEHGLKFVKSDKNFYNVN